MREIQAFILDLDGVLTDTAAYHYRAWKQLADEEGIPFNRQDNEQLRGVSRRQSLELLLGDIICRYTEDEKLEMMARKNGYYVEMLEQITVDDFLPGAENLLQDLRARGLKVAIGSASKNTKTVLDRLGILHEFDAISNGHSVTKAKPAPDGFLFAAVEMGVAPEHCAVIEDAASGVQAALAANMLSIGIGPAERVGHAHLRYDSTAKVDLDEILAYR